MATIVLSDLKGTIPSSLKITQVAATLWMEGLERMDNTIKGSESAELKLHQPVLAVLPALSGEQLENVATMFIREPNSHHAEAIRTARTGIQLSNVDQNHRLLVVTSSVPAEGKTSTTINLALALSQTKRTLLIDGDMRRPQVGVRLGLAPNAKGLSNLVTGTASLKECVHAVEGSSLLVMPAGDIPPNPLDLLLSQRFKEAIRHLQPQLDFILIDTPPVELVSDALSIAPMATSTIYVVRATETPVPVIRKGLSRLQRARQRSGLRGRAALLRRVRQRGIRQHLLSWVCRAAAGDPRHDHLIARLHA